MLIIAILYFRQLSFIQSKEFHPNSNGTIIDNQKIINKLMDIFMELSSPNNTLIKSLPKSIDWRSKGIITPVKSQGVPCGSCWAFGAVSQIESYLGLQKRYTGHHRYLRLLSTQQLTSCARNSYICGGTGGCNGGTIELGYYYAQTFGLVTEKDYPYLNSRFNVSVECDHEAIKRAPESYKISGYRVLPSNNVNAIMSHLAFRGPLAVNLALSKVVGYNEYKGGVYDGCDQMTDDDWIITHVMQLIGYGTTDDGLDYWLLRNSYGTKFGENGYIRIKRQGINVKCGINKKPLIGTGCVDDDRLKQQIICGSCGILFHASYPII